MRTSRKPAVRNQHRPAYKRLCKLLQEWRSEAGLTQRDLADLLRKPRSFVSKSETGERRVDPLDLVIWCRACKVDVAVAIRKIEQLV